MFDVLAPFLATIGLIALSAGVGILPMRKIVQMREARHELKHGSASFLRAMSGWLFIALWLTATWFCATIIGDWGVTGDLDGAIARSGRRLEILLHLLAAFADG